MNIFMCSFLFLCFCFVLFVFCENSYGRCKPGLPVRLLTPPEIPESSHRLNCKSDIASYVVWYKKYCMYICDTGMFRWIFRFDSELPRHHFGDPKAQATAKISNCSPVEVQLWFRYHNIGLSRWLNLAIGSGYPDSNWASISIPRLHVLYADKLKMG